MLVATALPARAEESAASLPPATPTPAAASESAAASSAAKLSVPVPMELASLPSVAGRVRPEAEQFELATSLVFRAGVQPPAPKETFDLRSYKQRDRDANVSWWYQPVSDRELMTGFVLEGFGLGELARNECAAPVRTVTDRVRIEPTPAAPALTKTSPAEPLPATD